jgi:hypothetical protein
MLTTVHRYTSSLQLTLSRSATLLTATVALVAEHNRLLNEYHGVTTGGNNLCINILAHEPTNPGYKKQGAMSAASSPLCKNCRLKFQAINKTGEPVNENGKRKHQSEHRGTQFTRFEYWTYVNIVIQFDRLQGAEATRTTLRMLVEAPSESAYFLEQSKRVQDGVRPYKPRGSCGQRRCYTEEVTLLFSVSVVSG